MSTSVEPKEFARQAARPMVYLDTSALVKLVADEPGSDELRAYLAGDRAPTRFSSMISHAELLRASSPHGPAAMATARQVLSTLILVDVTRDLLERAGTLNIGWRIRTLDVIHVLTAAIAQERLQALLTYDERMAKVAEALGFTALAP